MKSLFLKSISNTLKIFVVTYSLSAQSADFTKADLFGVEIDMTKDQAVHEIAKHFGINKSSIRSTVTGSKEIVFYESLSFENKKGIEASVRLDDADGEMKVNNIKYKIPYNKENLDRLKLLSIEKYGKPTASAMGVLYWCNNPKNNSQQYQKCMDKKNETTIRQTSNWIEISGNKTRAQEKLERLKTVAPSF